MSLPEGTRAELIDGDIFMSPAPRVPHQDVVGNVYTLLRRHASEGILGRVFVAPLDVHLPTGDIVQPDVLFVAALNSGIIQDWVRGTPDLVVQVLSPENRERDLIIKRGLYATNGVREYWIIDPSAKAVEVLTLRGAQYEPLGYFQNEDVLVSLVLPALKVKVSDFCEEQPGLI